MVVIIGIGHGYYDNYVIGYVNGAYITATIDGEYAYGLSSPAYEEYLTESLIEEYNWVLQ